LSEEGQFFRRPSEDRSLEAVLQKLQFGLEAEAIAKRVPSGEMVVSETQALTFQADKRKIRLLT
jgi:hypothetical protein